MENDETRFMDRVSTFDHGYNSENPAFVQEGHLMMMDFKIQIADGKERERLTAIKTKMMAEMSPENLQILQTQATVATKDEHVVAKEVGLAEAGAALFRSKKIQENK